MDMNTVDLDRALRAAVADAPPTTIDVDRLIHGQQRRQRTMRTLAVVCGAAASVLMVVMVLFLPSGRSPVPYRVTPATAQAVPSSSPRPCPSLARTGDPRAYQSGNASPRPVSESCGDAAFRLDSALARALVTHAPGATAADATGASRPVRFVRVNDQNLKYAASLSLTGPGGRGGASVVLEPRTNAPASEADLRHNYGCDRSPSHGVTCVYRTYPDGTVASGIVVASESASLSGPAGARQYQFDVFRPDDTVVTLIVNNTYYEGVPDPNVTPKLGGKDTPLTLEQIIAIGRDPGLTLYP